MRRRKVPSGGGRSRDPRDRTLELTIRLVEEHRDEARIQVPDRIARDPRNRRPGDRPIHDRGNHHTAGTPPMPAIVATVIIGIATLVSAAGIARGWKRAFAVAMTCRIIDGISSALGLLAHPSALLVTTGALGVVLSVAAIVLLVRLSPRRVLRRAASGSGRFRIGTHPGATGALLTAA
jgi:hypothetical protein